MLLASGFAGWLWDQHGAQATFYGGAAFAFFALIGLSLKRRGLGLKHS
jgi:hypothetical protein